MAKRLWAKMVPFIRKMLAHPCEDSFWLRGQLGKTRTGKTVPVLIQSGWFDDNGMGTTEALDLTAGYPPGTRKVVLGPWQPQRQQQVRPARPILSRRSTAV